MVGGKPLLSERGFRSANRASADLPGNLPPTYQGWEVGSTSGHDHDRCDVSASYMVNSFAVHCLRLNMDASIDGAISVCICV